MAIYALGSSQQALAYLRLAQYFHFSCCKRKIRWGKAWNCHHQRALPTITQLWFKAKWQSIIELSGAPYGLFTEFRHTAAGSKEHRSLLIHRQSRRGPLMLQVPLVLRNPLHVLWLLHQPQQSSHKTSPCQAETKACPPSMGLPTWGEEAMPCRKLLKSL